MSLNFCFYAIFRAEFVHPMFVHSSCKLTDESSLSAGAFWGSGAILFSLFQVAFLCQSLNQLQVECKNVQKCRKLEDDCEIASVLLFVQFVLVCLSGLKPGLAASCVFLI
jgi:hypothetical protein